MGYRIVDWKHFEPRHGNRDQYAYRIPNILVPTDVSHLEYIRLTAGSHGAANLGCWIGIVEYWARQKKELRDGGNLWDGDRPASSADIALACRLPIKAMEAAVSKLLEIKWLENTAAACQPDVSQASATWQHKTETETETKEETEVRYATLTHLDPEIKFVRLTQEQYDTLKTKYGTPATDFKILALDNWFHDNPKERSKRDHYRTLNNWLMRKENESKQPTNGRGVPAPAGKYDGIGIKTTG